MGVSGAGNVEDVSLVKDGFIERHRLYTIRAGELVHDNVHKEIKVADSELVKVREKGGNRGCIFYLDEEKACGIYEHRPIQCVAMACWDHSKFMEVFAGPQAEREEIVEDNVLLGLIREHEKRCSYGRLEELVKEIEQVGEEAIGQILELLKFDYHLRRFVPEKMGVDINETDFLFGRPLLETITMFGLKVIREPDGTFFLTVARSRSKPNL